MNPSRNLLLLVLASILLSQVLTLDCSTVAHSNGTDAVNPDHCKCETKYFWNKKACVTLIEYFESLETSEVEVDIAEATTCEDYQFSASDGCFDCDSKVTFCASCTADGNSTDGNSTDANSTDSNATVDFSSATVTCATCLDFAYLEAGECLLCSTAIPNCFECSNSTVCTTCESNFYLNGTTCVAEPTCAVSFCDICSETSENLCTACLGDYILETDNATDVSTCTEPTCSGDLEFNGLACSCNEGFYPSGTTCVQCP